MATVSFFLHLNPLNFVIKIEMIHESRFSKPSCSNLNFAFAKLKSKYATVSISFRKIIMILLKSGRKFCVCLRKS